MCACLPLTKACWEISLEVQENLICTPEKNILHLFPAGMSVMFKITAGCKMGLCCTAFESVPGSPAGCACLLRVHVDFIAYLNLSVFVVVFSFCTCSQNSQLSLYVKTHKTRHGHLASFISLPLDIWQIMGFILPLITSNI